MKILAVQTPIHLGTLEQRLDLHLSYMKKAVQIDADIVVFPELSLIPTHETLNIPHRNVSDAVDTLVKFARKNNLSTGFGYISFEGAQKLNTWSFFPRTSNPITQNKISLAPMLDDGFLPAENLRFGQFEGRKIATLICKDSNNLSNWGELNDKKIDIVFLPFRARAHSKFLSLEEKKKIQKQFFDEELAKARTMSKLGGFNIVAFSEAGVSEQDDMFFPGVLFLVSSSGKTIVSFGSEWSESHLSANITD